MKLLMPQPATFLSDKKAINSLLKIKLVGGFIVLGLFLFILPILADVILTDDFESYDLGDIVPQSDWEYGNSRFDVVDVGCNEGEKCIKSALTSNAFMFREGTLTSEGEFSIDIKVDTGLNSDLFIMVGSSTEKKIGLALNPNSDEIWIRTCDTYPDKIFLKENWELRDNWFNLQFKWSNTSGKLSAKYNDEGWVECDAYSTLIGEMNYDYFYLLQATGDPDDYFWVDNISIPFSCDNYTNNYACANAGCCWEWFYYDYFCVECPIGECGSGIWDCQNCLTQENCEAQDYCYWFDERCKYGTGVCGEGLELVFCENKTDCENAGGYWYDDFCWLMPKTELLISWSDYYYLYGDYATPTAWITGLASTTGNFFGKIGGFLSAFENNFDLQEAKIKGESLGQIIPNARGYLGILDDFLGGLPIGELFVFVLVFLLAIGTFRIVRNLIQLVKFW